MITVHVCTGGKCQQQGAEKIYRALETIIQKKRISAKMEIRSCGCIQKCSFGPNIKIIQHGKPEIFRSSVSEKSLESIVENLSRPAIGSAQQNIKNLLSGGF